MWPWEHAAVGYLLLSLGSRASGRSPPSTAVALALLLGTQLPDLVDKPLSWEFDLFPSGYAVGHSVFVAVPLGLLVLALARRTDRSSVGIALVVGYWSHLVADVFAPLRGGGGPMVSRMLWPVVVASPYQRDFGLGRGLVYLGRFLADLPSMDVTTVLVLYLILPLATLVLWVLDGSPGLSAVASAVRGVR